MPNCSFVREYLCGGLMGGGRSLDGPTVGGLRLKRPRLRSLGCSLRAPIRTNRYSDCIEETSHPSRALIPRRSSLKHKVRFQVHLDQFSSHTSKTLTML